LRILKRRKRFSKKEKGKKKKRNALLRNKKVKDLESRQNRRRYCWNKSVLEFLRNSG
jgi:hypothetical protein